MFGCSALGSRKETVNRITIASYELYQEDERAKLGKLLIN
jgi:hypothetical protein